MTEPSPFFDPDAPEADLEEFLAEVELRFTSCVPAFHEHLLLGRKDPSQGEDLIDLP